MRTEAPLVRIIRFQLEAAALRFGLAIFRALPVDIASFLGGWFGRTIGPHLRAQRTAERNIRRALPHLGEAEVQQILDGMWDNIGRVLGEYAHLPKLLADRSRVELVDPDHVAATLRDDRIGALLLSAHFGNWELSATPGYRSGLRQTNFYRALNNPYADAILRGLREPLTPGGFLVKGVDGTRRAIALLKAGAHIGLLADQKQNDGIAVPFFGRDAMTTPAPAALAQIANVPIVADKVERLRGAHFRVTVYKISPAASGDRKADIAETTRRLNALFEDWIRDRPDLWFWVHRRWPD